MGKGRRIKEVETEDGYIITAEGMRVHESLCPTPITCIDLEVEEKTSPGFIADGPRRTSFQVGDHVKSGERNSRAM